jgi:anti-sigma B factor antagonist
MQISERHVGDVAIIDLNGRLVLGEGDDRIRDKVNSLLQQGKQHIIVNLSNVSYMDSAGLGQLVGCYTTVTRRGGALKLLGLTKRVTDLLAITKLLTVFDSYDTEAEAVASFGPVGVK